MSGEEPSLPGVDPLLELMPSDSKLSRVREALLTEGYFVFESPVLSPIECEEAIDRIWDFVEDSSGGIVDRSLPSTWYPASEDVGDDETFDPWPHTGYKSFSDMFQSLGAGFVNGRIRELLAERVFEPLFGTSELHTSKEGFTFHRPTAPENYRPPEFWLRQLSERPLVCGLRQAESLGEHYDQAHGLKGLHTLQSLISLDDQEEGVDGCFLCYPRSHSSVHDELTKDIYRGRFPWVPLTDDETRALRIKYGLVPKRIYLTKGSMLIWRSDLVHAAVPPQGDTPRFRSVVYTSMQPASRTPSSVLSQKMMAYKQRQTGDHRPQVESWHMHKRAGKAKEVCRMSFRTSPPLVTERLAQLYGILPYGLTDDDQEVEKDRAVVRGVRFESTRESFSCESRQCDARLEIIEATNETELSGQDKYLGGVSSPCGRYVFGVPGSAKRVLRIHTKLNKMDFIGPYFDGKFKWLRGVDIPSEVMMSKLFPYGCCLALPSNSCSVLKINPANDEVTTFGSAVLSSAGKTGWLYHGGNLAFNGFVYAIPANATHVAKICPRNDSVELIGPSFGPEKQKWFGGIIGIDSCIYGIPHNERGVLKIDPETDECKVLYQENNTPLASGSFKWHGGIAAGDKVFGYPNNSDEILVVNVAEQRVYTVHDTSGTVQLRSGRHRIPQDGRYKWLGGALTLDGSKLYLFPCDAEQVLMIDTKNDKFQLVGPMLLDGENKYQNGFVGRDGHLYGIPQRAMGILRINPFDDHVDVMDCRDLIGVKDKFEGGVMGKDGCIYCIPLRSKVCVKIVPPLSGQS